MTFGGAFMIIGFAHRPVSLALFVTMTVATSWKYYPFAGWDAADHPAAMAIVCLGLLFTGPGKYSLDAKS
jgi:putative oxidoreductase